MFTMLVINSSLNWDAFIPTFDTVEIMSVVTTHAYATSFMVMGLERAQQILERHPELMAYFIYSDEHGRNAVWFSPSLRDKIAE